MQRLKQRWMIIWRGLASFAKQAVFQFVRVGISLAVARVYDRGSG